MAEKALSRSESFEEPWQADMPLQPLQEEGGVGSRPLTRHPRQEDEQANAALSSFGSFTPLLPTAADSLFAL